MEKRLRTIKEIKLNDEQSGKNDHIFTLQQITEKAIAKNKAAYYYFIDMKKASDSINGELI